MTATTQPLSWTTATPMVRQAAMSTAPPENVIPRSWFRNHIRDFDLWLVCEGRVELFGSDDSKAILTRGSAVWLRPGLEFELRVDGSGPYTNAFIHFDFLDKSGEVIPHQLVETPAVLGTVHDIPYFESTMRRIMYLQYQISQTEPRFHAVIRSLATQLLKGLLHDYELAQLIAGDPSGAGIKKHHAQTISSALSWIYLHPESNHSAADLAKRFGYSQRHFCRLFRMETGRTPGQAQIEARIDNAKKLLSSSALNVSEIAESLGYENVFYFSRQFKKVTGVAPAHFRSLPPARRARSVPLNCP